MWYKSFDQFFEQNLLRTVTIGNNLKEFAMKRPSKRKKSPKKRVKKAPGWVYGPNLKGKLVKVGWEDTEGNLHLTATGRRLLRRAAKR